MARSIRFHSGDVAEALLLHTELERMLGELDRLGLHEPGAHLSLAIHALERRIHATGRVVSWPSSECSRPS